MLLVLGCKLLDLNILGFYAIFLFSGLRCCVAGLSFYTRVGQVIVGFQVVGCMF